MKCSTSEFDVTELESLFAAVVPKSNDQKSDGQRKSAGSKSDKVHLVTLLSILPVVEKVHMICRDQCYFCAAR